MTPPVVAGRLEGLLRPGPLLRVAGVLGVLLTVSGVAVHQFAPERVLVLVGLVFAVGLLFRDAASVLRFHVAVMFGVAAAMVWRGSLTPPPLVLGVLATVAITSFVVARSRDRDARRLEQLALVAERVENGVAVVLATGEIAWFNRAFGLWFDLADRRVEGFTLVELIRDPHAVHRVQRAVESGRSLSLQVEQPTPDGVRWFTLDLTPVRDASGKCTRSFAVLTDVTKAHEMSTGIWNALAEVMLVVERDGTVVEANEAAERVLGASPVGRPLDECVADETMRARLHGLLTRLDAPLVESLAMELRGQPDAIPVEATVSRLPADPDQRRRVVIVARDVRERLRSERDRHALEERVREARYMENLGLLAGGIAHDFNNLLGGILGNAALLLTQLPAGSGLRPILARIESSAQRATDLTQQLLAYAGRGPTRPKPVDLLGLVRGEVQLRREDVRFGRMDEQLAVEGDLRQLRVLVGQLLQNAADASPGDSVIEVSVERRALERGAEEGPAWTDRLAPGSYAVLRVAHSGAIPGPLRDRMFDAFYVTRPGSTGLGLAACRGVARGHGGAMRVVGAEGGSVVEAWLPLCSHEVIAEPSTPPPPDPRASPCVLLVDDEPELLEFARTVLEHAGYRVRVARDGEEGVRVFREHAPDIQAVILDLTMPRLKGEDALKEIRAVRDVPVVIASGYTAPDQDASLGDVAGFLPKPYRARDLLSIVARAIDDRKTVAAP